MLYFYLPTVAVPPEVGGGTTKPKIVEDVIFINMSTYECLEITKVLRIDRSGWFQIKAVIEDAKVSVWNINKWENESRLFLNYGNNTLKFKICSSDPIITKGKIEIENQLRLIIVEINLVVSDDEIDTETTNESTEEGKTEENKRKSAETTGQIISANVFNTAIPILIIIIIFLWIWISGKDKKTDMIKREKEKKKIEKRLLALKKATEKLNRRIKKLKRAR